MRTFNNSKIPKM